MATETQSCKAMISNTESRFTVKRLLNPAQRKENHIKVADPPHKALRCSNYQDLIFGAICIVLMCINDDFF